MTTTTKTKLETLAEYLECDPDDISESSYDDNHFECGSQEYLVMTDEEADEATEAYILDSLWAFNADFIASHANARLNGAAIKALQEMQGKLCESANELVKALIKDLDHFVQDAISAEGRGHFLSQYDGNENEAGDYFIYRTN